MMTSRERLFAALNGTPTDRVPVWLLFPYHTTSYYVDVRTHPKYRPVFEKSLQYAVTLDRRNLSVPLHTPDVRTYHEETVEGEWHVVRNCVEFGSERLCGETRTNGIETTTTKLLETDDDLELFASLPIEADPEQLAAFLDRQLPDYLREKGEFPEEYGAMMLDLGEPISVLYHASNLQSYALWSLTRSETVEQLLRRIMAHYRIVYGYCLERGLADVYFLVGSEVASPPLVSRNTFQRWVVPFARELIDMIQGYGKKVIQHYHGQIRTILPDFLTMAPDGLHTIEAPPIGNCTLTQAFDILGDSVTLIGNLQYDDFRAFSPGQMQEAVRNVLDECRGKRFILSPTAGPFDWDAPPAIIRNYDVFMDAAWRYDAPQTYA